MSCRVWGSVCLSVAFVWQLYTIYLLIRLHESVPGIRHSRYLFLAMAAFVIEIEVVDICILLWMSGKRLGKVAALFPVMYLSGGSCVILIIVGGGTMKLLFKTLCDNNDHAQTCNSHSLSGAECFLVFTCLAILIAQLPNLNSLAYVSLIGGVTSITYCTLFWTLSVKNGRPTSVSYTTSLSNDHSSVAKIADIINAIGLIVIAFRGHNVLLEIQGSLPSNLEGTSEEPMRIGVTVSYILIAICLFPLAIVGFWAYGNQINGGLLTAFPEFHRDQVTKFTMGAMYVLLIIHCLTSFQVYAMLVFDNLEIRYTSIKNHRCPRLVRTCFRIFFGGFTFFIAVTFPFLPSLSVLMGGMTLVPVTYAYPCFMWLAIKKPPTKGVVWCFNFALGCLGMIFSILLVTAAVRTLAIRGLKANFFHP
ncbi:putative amino acid transporter, transmembrane domain-containing protein [Lupinus albus]|uniref:Putative amino acid transporter, transmembrane domain-containing protein n=1 Tax=Lupinus albus TaxID=3870 RepID=A0A6A4QQU9_LUPAL|nr:putative amino acid transporter, transmembrane domain-containing protein [Lupinus albus]